LARLNIYTNMEINNNLSVTCSFTAELVIVLSQH